MILTILLVFFFTGCSLGTPKVVYSPPLNKEARAEIGQNMFEKIYANYSEYAEEVVLLNKTGFQIDKRNKHPYFYKNEDNQCSMLGYYRI